MKAPGIASARSRPLDPNRMPLHFTTVCDFLSDLEELETREPSSTKPWMSFAIREKILDKWIERTLPAKRNKLINEWIEKNRSVIETQDTDLAALLSTLLPGRRIDRVYGIKSSRLCQILRQQLIVGIRGVALEQWKVHGSGGLPICVEKLLSEGWCGNRIGEQLTVEQVDELLGKIASQSRYSSPKVRAKFQNVNVNKELGAVYNRCLSPNEAKWFTRLILKDLSPLWFHEWDLMGKFHDSLPSVIKIRDDLEMAVSVIRGPAFAPTAKLTTEEDYVRRQEQFSTFLPQIGIRVGTPFFLKGWSVNYIAEVAHERRMALEQKFDGEYCQIHVSITNKKPHVQIFSKSGKDSTNDRKLVHSAIDNCLGLGTERCQFSKSCIVVGELVAWDKVKEKVLFFDKIRSHVVRGGHVNPVDEAAASLSSENLMIMFFDVLDVDGEPVIHETYAKRRGRLQRLITPIKGQGEIVPIQELDFSRSGTIDRLCAALSDAFAQKWEGHVLKPLDDPYMNFEGFNQENRHRSCLIKLKRHYIPGLGDTADMAVVGAGYDAEEAVRLKAKYKLSRVPLTHFHVGCLLNKEAVLNHGAKPHYQVVDAFNQGLHRKQLRHLYQHADFNCKDGKPRTVDVDDSEAEEACELTIANSQFYFSAMTVVFREPFVFEVKGSAFERPKGTRYWILRFPRVLKIRHDLDSNETITFRELQDFGEETMTNTGGGLQEDVDRWRRRLEAAKSASKHGSRWREGTPDEDQVMDFSDDDTSSETSDEPSSQPSDEQLSDEALKENDRRAPSMVRVDTAEMLPGEARADGGGVRSRKSTPDSGSSTESAPSVPTSQVPVPLLTTSGSPTQPKKTEAGSSSAGLKRSHEEVEADDENRVTRPRLIGIISGRASPSSKTAEKDLPKSTGAREPLQDVKNDAQAVPSQSVQLAPTTDIHAKLSHCLQLVRKLPIGAKRVSRRNRTKPPDFMSSPERETTASEQTPGPDSQSTASQPTGQSQNNKETGPYELSTQSDFPSSPSPYLPTSGSQYSQDSQATLPPLNEETSSKKRPFSKITTDVDIASSPPASPRKRRAIARTGYESASPPPVPASEEPSMPSFQGCWAILSPCLAPVPYVRENLASFHGLRLLVREELDRMTEEILAEDRVVVLVEENRFYETGQFLQHLVPELARYRHPIYIWDWRILDELMQNPEITNPSLLRTVPVGCIRRTDSGRVLIWRDGEVTELELDEAKE